MFRRAASCGGSSSASLHLCRTSAGDLRHPLSPPSPALPLSASVRYSRCSSCASEHLTCGCTAGVALAVRRAGIPPDKLSCPIMAAATSRCRRGLRSLPSNRAPRRRDRIAYGTLLGSLSVALSAAQGLCVDWAVSWSISWHASWAVLVAAFPRLDRLGLTAAGVARTAPLMYHAASGPRWWPWISGERYTSCSARPSRWRVVAIVAGFARDAA